MTDSAEMESIALQMSSGDEEVRLAGLRRLSSLGATDSLGLIFKAFADDSWRVRKEAADLFLTMPVSRELVGEIIELLHAEENAGLRNTAVDILVRMGRDAVPLLLDQAGCPDHDVRKFILDILGEIADQRAVSAMVAALDDPDENVRAAAAENLGKLRAVEALPALLDAMRHSDLLLRFTILDTLGKIGAPVPLERLLSLKNDKLLRKALIDCLGKVGDAASVSELLAGLVDPMRNVREASLKGLLALAERYPEMVRTTLAGHDFPATLEMVAGYLAPDLPLNLRLAAVRVLGWLGNPDGFRPLLGLLDDEGLLPEVLSALVSIGVRSPRVLCAAWSDSSSLQRAYLAYAIGEAGGVDGLPLLRHGLTDGDPRLAQMSAHALGRLGDEADLVTLAAALGHDNADVRDAASGSLEKLGARFPDAALAALEPILNDGEPTHRSAAVNVLGGLDENIVAGRLIMALKDPAAEVRRSSLKAIGKIGVDKHLHAILLALTDEDVDVRRIAVQLLANATDRSAIDGLRLALQDEDLWVRSAAIRGLGRVGGETDAETISRFARDPVGLVCIAALETLAEVMGDGACPAFITAMDHHDEEVVNVAMELLARYGASEWLSTNAEELINHPAWNVRAHCVRLLAALQGEEVRTLLERRLLHEKDELVRQQILASLADLAS